MPNLLRSLFKTAFDAYDAEVQPVPPGYVPPTVSVSYRWSSLQVGAVFCVLFAFVWIYGTLSGGPKDQPMALFGVLVLLVAIVLELKAWNEKVILSPKGLEFFNWTGQLKIFVPLEGIIDEGWTTKDSTRIDTTQGSFYVYGAYSGQGYQLLLEVRKILRSRQAQAATPSMGTNLPYN